MDNLEVQAPSNNKQSYFFILFFVHGLSWALPITLIFYLILKPGLALLETFYITLFPFALVSIIGPIYLILEINQRLKRSKDSGRRGDFIKFVIVISSIGLLFSFFTYWFADTILP